MGVNLADAPSLEEKLPRLALFQICRKQHDSALLFCYDGLNVPVLCPPKVLVTFELWHISPCYSYRARASSSELQSGEGNYAAFLKRWNVFSFLFSFFCRIETGLFSQNSKQHFFSHHKSHLINRMSSLARTTKKTTRSSLYHVNKLARVILTEFLNINTKFWHCVSPTYYIDQVLLTFVMETQLVIWGKQINQNTRKKTCQGQQKKKFNWMI